MRMFDRLRFVLVALMVLLGRRIAMRPIVQLGGDPEEFRTPAGIPCGNLSGYTASTRLGVFALRPAPLQVLWLAYPSTIGGDFGSTVSR